MSTERNVQRAWTETTPTRRFIVRTDHRTASWRTGGDGYAGLEVTNYADKHGIPHKHIEVCLTEVADIGGPARRTSLSVNEDSTRKLYEFLQGIFENEGIT